MPEEEGELGEEVPAEGGGEGAAGAGEGGAVRGGGEDAREEGEQEEGAEDGPEEEREDHGGDVVAVDGVEVRAGAGVFGAWHLSGGVPGGRGD